MEKISSIPTSNKRKSLFLSMIQDISQDNCLAWKNPWFLGIVATIAVFFLVNIIFIVFAVTSNPGLVVDDYYEKGREFENNVVTRLTARNKLNWQTKLEIPSVVYNHATETFRFSAVDSRGLSIEEADVSIIAYRPSDASADFSQALEPVAPGLYQAQLQFSLAGVWDINLKVTRGSDKFYQSQRIHVLSSAEAK